MEEILDTVVSWAEMITKKPVFLTVQGHDPANQVSKLSIQLHGDDWATEVT